MLRTPNPARSALLAAALTVTSLTALVGCRVVARTLRPAGKTDDVIIGIAFNPERPGMQEIARGAMLAAAALNSDAAALSAGMHFATRLPPPRATSAVQVAQMYRDNPSV